MNNFFLKKSSIFIAFTFLFLFFISCQKEKADPITLIQESTTVETRNYNGNSSHPFYQTEYVKEELELNLPAGVSAQIIYTMMDEMQALSYESQIVNAFEIRNNFPCWSCGEVDFNDQNETHFTIVPVINIIERTVEALMVRSESSSEIKIIHLKTELLESSSDYLENQYYVNFLEYFRKILNEEIVDVNNYKYFKSMTCWESSTGECVCSDGSPCDCENRDCGTVTDEIDHTDGSSGGGSIPKPIIFSRPAFALNWSFDWGQFISNIFNWQGSVESQNGNATGNGSNSNNINILDATDIIVGLLRYIQDNTSINLTSVQHDVLTNIFEHFDLIIYPLANNIENLNEVQIQAYLDFIEDNPYFIESLEESLFLQSSSSMATSLSSFLSNHENELGNNLGHAILQIFIEGTNELPVKLSFVNLNEVYDEHTYLLNTYPNFSGENIDPALFIVQHGIKAYLGVAKMYDLFMQELNEIPSLDYQWQIAMEEFSQAIEIALGFIPVLGDLMSAYDNLVDGAIFWACFDLAGAVFPNELYKIVKNSKNIRDAWKDVKIFWGIWNKVNTPGAEKVWNNMPSVWRNLEHKKVLKTEKGLQWSLSKHTNIRVMKAVPNSEYINQRVPYIRLNKNGTRLDKFGNSIQSNNPDFQELTHIPISELTDELLNFFFEQ